MQVLSIDIGGTFLKKAIVDHSGEVHEFESIKVPQHYEELLQLIAQKYKEAIDVEECICISSPCNYHDSKLQGSSYVEYLVGKDLINDLKNILNIEIFLENDGNCSALGEAFSGFGKGVSDFVNIVIGSGVGGGIIINHQLLKGNNNLAGDIGYMFLHPVVRTDNINHSMGMRGGTTYLINTCKKIDEKYYTAEIILDHYNLDQQIKVEVDNFIRYLSLGIINIMYTVSPSVFLLSGGVTKHPELLNLINQDIINITSMSSAYKYIPKVMISKHKNNSNLIGAASIFFKGVK